MKQEIASAASEGEATRQRGGEAGTRRFSCLPKSPQQRPVASEEAFKKGNAT